MTTTSAFTGRLTDADLELVAAERDRWMTVGHSTERCDRERAELAVRRAYTTAGLDEPPLVIWMDSPLGGVYATTFLKQVFTDGQLGGELWGELEGQIDDQIGDRLGDQIGDQLGGQLWGQLGGQLWGQLGVQLRDQLRAQLGGQLWGQLGDQLGGQLWDQIGDQLRDQLRGQLWDHLDPWWESYWLALYQSALPIAGLPASERLDALAEAVAATGWWWPMRGAVVMTDRPTALHVDQLGRLHHQSGPALAYADGYPLYAWHGTRVPADLIESGWSTDRILKEPNAEVRRCAIERMGWDAFITEAGLEQVGPTMPDPGNPGKSLSLFDVPEAIYDSPVRVLLCTNGTPERDGTVHRFGLTVPADIKSPVAASAWTFGLTEAEYAGLQRRT